jgi:hypothetical protein
VSNYLAPATVTAALAQLVQTAAQKAVSGATVEIGRPSAPNNNAALHRINLYLYQVTPNAALRNADLPTRDAQGRLSQRPQVALDLHYLLAFYGDEKTLEPERMLGAVARDLHARPLLTRVVIEDAIASSPDLNGSDLADAIESVTFTPVVLSLDELSKLWSIFFQTPHTLSMIYQGTVVLIEAEEGAAPAPPVLRRGDQDRGVDTLLGPFPRLEDVFVGEPADSSQNRPAAADLRPRPPSFPGAQLGLQVVLAGENLAGDSTQVEFAHPRLAAAQLLDPVSLESGEIRIDLPDAGNSVAQIEWAAGLYSVRAMVQRGDSLKTSNTVPMALAPRITQIQPANPIPGAGGNVALTVTCSPQVLPEQSAELLLVDRQVTADPHPAPTDTLAFVIENAPSVQDALVRVRVDGVESMPFVRTGSPLRLVFDDAQKVTIQ